MRRKSNRGIGRIVPALLSCGLIAWSSSPSQAQLRDVLDDLLGRSDEIRELQELERSDRGAKLLVTLVELESPDEVLLMTRMLDTSLRTLDGFRILPVTLVEGFAEEVTLNVAYNGTSEVRSAVVEVLLERNGRRFARRRFPMVRTWAGLEGHRANLGEGGESEQGVPRPRGSSGSPAEGVILTPIPRGNTPSNTPSEVSGGGSGNSSGSTPRGSTSGRGVVLTAPTGGVVSNSATCERAVQGKIAWNYSGSKTWGSSNIARLCRGATTSAEPARCFDRVMHGGVNWGGGTRWQWKNAIDLCEGSTNAAATIGCFQKELKAGRDWEKATKSCGK